MEKKIFYPRSSCSSTDVLEIGILLVIQKMCEMSVIILRIYGKVIILIYDDLRISIVFFML